MPPGPVRLPYLKLISGAVTVLMNATRAVRPAKKNRPIFLASLLKFQWWSDGTRGSGSIRQISSNTGENEENRKGLFDEYTI